MIAVCIGAFAASPASAMGQRSEICGSWNNDCEIPTTSSFRFDRFDRENFRTDRAPTPREKAAEAYNEALALGQQGRDAEAEARYRDAIRLNASFPPAWNNLGSILFNTGRYGEALSAFKRAMDLDAGYGIARDNYFALKNWLDAEQRHREEEARYQRQMREYWAREAERQKAEAVRQQAEKDRHQVARARLNELMSNLDRAAQGAQEMFPGPTFNYVPASVVDLRDVPEDRLVVTPIRGQAMRDAPAGRPAPAAVEPLDQQEMADLLELIFSGGSSGAGSRQAADDVAGVLDRLGSWGAKLRAAFDKPGAQDGTPPAAAVFEEWANSEPCGSIDCSRFETNNRLLEAIGSPDDAARRFASSKKGRFGKVDVMLAALHYANLAELGGEFSTDDKWALSFGFLERLSPDHPAAKQALDELHRIRAGAK